MLLMAADRGVKLDDVINNGMTEWSSPMTSLLVA